MVKQHIQNNTAQEGIEQQILRKVCKHKSFKSQTSAHSWFALQHNLIVLSHYAGYTPALSCASNDKVADCLAIILAHMIPLSPENFNSKSRIALALTGELRRSRTSNSLDLTDGNRSRADSAADTSDSETYWA